MPGLLQMPQHHDAEHVPHMEARAGAIEADIGRERFFLQRGLKALPVGALLDKTAFFEHTEEIGGTGIG